MKNLLITIPVHILAWVLLLMVPFLSTYQVIKSFTPATTHVIMTPVLVLSLLLISVFYINYLVLIPRYLLPKKYLLYAATFLLFIGIAFALSGLIFYYFDFDPEKANPVISKISPIAKANAFLMLMISVLASISLAINNRLRQAEKEKLSAQIAYLKSQINPHFLFNTLNSIYATAIDTSPQTADMVDKLSEMMRYTMKEIQNDTVPLAEEVNYINNYIALQKMRLDSNIKFDYTTSGTWGELRIAPMLLIPFVENAFKHGVNAEQNSNISISLGVDKSELQFKVANNKVAVQTDAIEKTGLGIENTRHRLALIYPSCHLLTIVETADDFTVSLQISLL